MTARSSRNTRKRIRTKTVLWGVALAALLFPRPVLSQGECDGDYCPPPPASQCPSFEFCDGECPALPPCEQVEFSPGEPTQKFDFGNGHFIKVTANVQRPFSLAIQFFPTDSDELAARLNRGLAPANCIPYAGASSEEQGSCGFYHVVEPLPVKGDPGCTDCDYSGDVLYKVFWDLPSLGELNNPRLYRAPILPEDPQTCQNEGNCYTQDITDLVYTSGATGNPDPGVSGKGKGFSDYEVVDRLNGQDPCDGREDCTQITLPFSPDHETNKYDFGNHHFIKITTNVLQDFDLTVEFVPITQSELDPRLNQGLAPANCIRYAGATSNTALGSCGYYHIVEPLPIKGVDYDGDVFYKVFWDFPTLDQLHNVRLYRAPIPQEDQPTCTNGIDCFTQDLTGVVYAAGATGNSDPGVSGKGKSFSDYEVVDRTGGDLTAKVRLGLKWFWDYGIKFDLKAVVKRNGVEVSSGELLGSPGGFVLFQNAILRTIPLTFPIQTFESGDNISIKVLVRNSCLGSPQLTGVARLWYDDNSQSQVNVPGVPTLYLVRGEDDEREEWDHDRDRGDLSTTTSRLKRKRDVRVWPKVPSCDGPYRSFGTWSGTVPY